MSASPILLDPETRDGPLGRELGGMALGLVQLTLPDFEMADLRAAHWFNTLAKVGLAAPYWLVRDLGLLMVQGMDQVAFVPRYRSDQLRLGAAEDQAREFYRETLREISESEVLEKARQWRLSDDLVAVVLLKCLGPLIRRFVQDSGLRVPESVALPLDAMLFRSMPQHHLSLYSGQNRQWDTAVLRYLGEHRLRLITAVEQVDLDTLQLLGMFGQEASGALQMLDLLNVFESPEANDVVNFSLDLLPSVLETKRASGQQSFSVDGYAGVTRKGTIDSLVLSELAFDDDLFERRFAENEVFYYAREREHEEDRRLHYICVDASASMRGQRSVFARGLALTLAKKLSLQGEDVYLRFFDSRLYDVQSAKAGRSISAPYVLCFRGERGRNYAKVFGMLVGDLQRLQRRERRSPVLYLLTHAECHIPLESVERLSKLARLYGVFMLPSQGELELDYLELLDTIQIVDEDALRAGDARANRALEIVDDVSSQRPETQS